MSARAALRSIAAAAAVVLIATVAPDAEGSSPPSVRLIGTQRHVTAERFNKHDPVFLDLGLFVASAGGAFELRAKRADYDSPVYVSQVDAGTRATLRSLPPGFNDGWAGLAGFFELTIADGYGAIVSDVSATFCPNGFDLERTNDAGPVRSRYPSACVGSPFARGAVWGIEDGWAVGVFPFDDRSAPVLADGSYTVTVSIAEPYRSVFAVGESEASISIALDVVTTKPPKCRKRRCGPPPEKEKRHAVRRAPRSDATTADAVPDPSTLPDLEALPAWAISTFGEDGRDYLAFNATEANDGPGPLAVEGFRDPGSDVMTAYQYFFRDGKPVARTQAGYLEYHAGDGHDHWHFLQFAEYTLLDGEGRVVATSGKQSWCLAATDAVDLTLLAADWTPETGLTSACGARSSLWVRESLEVGWGDTYSQAVSGQSFDVTQLPNGHYTVRVEVNPSGILREVSSANNRAERGIELGGRPGARTVLVDPYHSVTD